MDCLICSEAITHARLGVNACRACAAFYQRADGQFGKLKCKDGEEKCREKNPKTTCRKCRLARFREVLARAREQSPQGDEITQSSMEIDASPPTTASTFVDHTSIYDCEPSSSSAPLLSKIRKGYSLMCIIRKAGEVSVKPDSSGESDVRIDNLVLTRAARSLIVPHTNIGKQGVIEFANLAFEDFRSLEDDSKKFIVDTSYCLLHILDSTYRVCHHFPGELEVKLPGYTTFFRSTELDRFFENCPDGSNKTTLIREVKSSIAHSSKSVRKHFEIVKPTDVEFLALFGLALWNDRLLERDETLLKIAARVRTQIMSELHDYYITNGTADYASRVGNIFCLLAGCLNQSAKYVEDFQVFRLLNMFGGVTPGK